MQMFELCSDARTRHTIRIETGARGLVCRVSDLHRAAWLPHYSPACSELPQQAGDKIEHTIPKHSICCNIHLHAGGATLLRSRWYCRNPQKLIPQSECAIADEPADMQISLERLVVSTSFLCSCNAALMGPEHGWIPLIGRPCRPECRAECKHVRVHPLDRELTSAQRPPATTGSIISVQPPSVFQPPPGVPPVSLLSAPLAATLVPVALQADAQHQSAGAADLSWHAGRPRQDFGFVGCPMDLGSRGRLHECLAHRAAGRP